MPAASTRSSPHTLRRIAHLARRRWPQLGMLFAINVASTALALLNPVPLKWVLDSALGQHPLPGVLQAVLPAGTGRDSAAVIAVLAGLMVAIALVKQLAQMGYAVLRTWTGERLVLGFRSAMFRHLQRLSLTYHDTKGAADSAYRIQYDAPAIQWIMVDGLLPLINAVVMLGAMAAILLRIDWMLALVALLVAPLLAGVSSIYSRRLKKLWRGAKDLEGAAHAVIQEVLGAVRVVKAFSAEDREQARYERQADRTLQEQLRVSLIASRFSLVVGLIMATGTAAVMYLGARHVQTGLLSVGDLVLVMSYLAMLYAPLETLTRSAGSLQGSIASAERAFELLDEEPDVVERPHARPLARARGAIAFADVSFAYRDQRPALHEVSFAVPAGARVGIAGHTGAGKTTLISLLMRLYDPTVGRVLLDGLDLRDYALRDLRNQFAIVLQEPVLFSGSIGENIAYARPEASQDEIVAAARAANAHDFIARLPERYATPVGERGHQLSGGERQRISLARAFLKDAPILILDEPTSSVDVKTEAGIIDSLDRLMQGRTTFMIAHRLSTLASCNVRIELEGGRLTQIASTNAAPTPA